MAGLRERSFGAQGGPPGELWARRGTTGRKAFFPDGGGQAERGAEFFPLGGLEEVEHFPVVVLVEDAARGFQEFLPVVPIARTVFDFGEAIDQAAIGVAGELKQIGEFFYTDSEGMQSGLIHPGPVAQFGDQDLGSGVGEAAGFSFLLEPDLDPLGELLEAFARCGAVLRGCVLQPGRVFRAHRGEVLDQADQAVAAVMFAQGEHVASENVHVAYSPSGLTQRSDGLEEAARFLVRLEHEGRNGCLNAARLSAERMHLAWMRVGRKLLEKLAQLSQWSSDASGVEHRSVRITLLAEAGEACR